MIPTLADLHPFASRAEAEHALAMPRIAELRGDSLADVQWYAQRAVAAGQWLERTSNSVVEQPAFNRRVVSSTLTGSTNSGSSNGRTSDFESDNGGSTPSPETIADQRAEELRRYGFAGWLRRELSVQTPEEFARWLDENFQRPIETWIEAIVARDAQIVADAAAKEWQRALANCRHEWWGTASSDGSSDLTCQKCGKRSVTPAGSVQQT